MKPLKKLDIREKERCAEQVEGDPHVDVLYANRETDRDDCASARIS